MNYSLLMKILMAGAGVGLAVSYGDIYAFHLALGMIVMHSAASRAPGTLFARFQPPSSFHHFFGFMLAWFALGLIWSWQRWYTLHYLGYVTCGMLLAIALVKYIGGCLERFEQLLAVACPVFFLDILAGLLEAFTSFRLPVSPMSTSGAFWQARSHAYSEEAIPFLLSSPTGFHWNPNNYAVVMLMLAPFFILHPRWLIKAAGAGAICVLIIYAGSRTALVAFVFVLFAAPAYVFWRTWIIGAAVALGVGVCVLLSGFFSNLDWVQNARLRDALGAVNAIEKYLSDEEFGDTGSVGVRRTLIRNGLNALHETYGLGLGGGGDAYVQEQFNWSVKERNAMHNYWIELLVCGGYLFFIVLVLWYGMLVYELFWHCHRLGSNHRIGYYAGALSLAMVGFVPGAVSAATTAYVLPMYILWGLAVSMVNVCRTQAWEEISLTDAAVGKA